MNILIKRVIMAIIGITALYTIDTYRIESIKNDNHILTIEYTNKNYDDIFHIEITGVK